MRKYHNIRTSCISGHAHDSKGEALYCNYLFIMKRDGRIIDYQIQVSFNLPGGIVHVVDFVVYKDDSPAGIYREVHEFKGFKTAVWRIKRKLFIEEYPNIPYKTIVRRSSQGRSKCQIRKKLLKMSLSQKKVLKKYLRQ